MSEQEPKPQDNREVEKPAAAVKVSKAAAEKPKEQVIELYQGAKRIHPKKAEGRYANIRIFMIVATQAFFYLMPWLVWNGRQAVWFDIVGDVGRFARPRRNRANAWRNQKQAL